MFVSRLSFIVIVIPTTTKNDRLTTDPVFSVAEKGNFSKTPFDS